MIPDDLLNLFGTASAGNHSGADVLKIMVLVPLGIALAAPLIALLDLSREYLSGPT